ncbi:hypothetical protein GCM10012275_07240 [Longimycelium tulufanense]|uniref:Tetrapyrrole methylase domain-containing protein n=1 Tax=Longimycelium tulufanense TaxID=907463 RepID=A0A8J3C6E5_9PSEU|nr:precorrin-4 C(11)-methyltransferase [Longimycelium tulufanense]GGM38884.1 hypothetical protein GCM10012275_07240 [Longimycelium tulufanense]
MSGRVSFVGAGPGAEDLITVRGARRIAEADVVVWPASVVVPECIREHARPDAELVDSTRTSPEQVLEICRRALRDKLKVARVLSGDPTMWGAVQEQYDACRRIGLEVEIVPGVSPVSAAAATVGRELTAPELAQSVILTRLEGGTTPARESERVRELATHGTTMAAFLSAAHTAQLAEELRDGGYAPDTPVVVAYKATCPDELILHTTLGELEETVKARKLWRHALFLVGRALGTGRSRSYRTDPQIRRPARRGSYRRSGATGPSAGATAYLRGHRQSTSTTASNGDVAVPAAPRRPESELAWWAVRDWQESARATRPRSDSQPVNGGETTDTPTEPDPVAEPAVVAAERPAATPDEGVAPAAADTPKPASLVAAATSTAGRVTARVTAGPRSGRARPTRANTGTERSTKARAAKGEPAGSKDAGADTGEQPRKRARKPTAKAAEDGAKTTRRTRKTGDAPAPKRRAPRST